MRDRRQRSGVMAVVAAAAVLITVSGCSSNGAGGGTGGSSSPETYNLGEAGPAGGIVFYDKGSYSDGWRYLEAWTADEAGTYLWKTAQTSTLGTSRDIGSGYDNTYNAMTGPEHPAAEVARNASHGGYTDWFLPSKDELNEMYMQRVSIGGFASVDYWSSSQSNGANAWAQYFGTGGPTFYLKDTNVFRVRAARAF